MVKIRFSLGNDPYDVLFFVPKALAVMAILLVVIAGAFDFFRKWFFTKTIFVTWFGRHYDRLVGGIAHNSTNWFLMTTLILVSFVCIEESGLRWMGMVSSKGERQGLGYVSPYTPQEKGWLHILSPNRICADSSSEFNYTFRTNDEGFVGRNWTLKKVKKKVACIGDSFTQGAGAPVDSSYPVLLGKMRPDIDVMNFGIMGSDPAFGLIVLQKKVLRYRPDIVTLTVNLTDFHDFIVKGGLERFSQYGTTHYRKAPWWIGIYSHSHIVRLWISSVLDIDDFTGGSRRTLAQKKEETIPLIEKALDSASALCAANHIRFIVIVHPIASEMKSGHLESCLDSLLLFSEKNYETIDVLSSYKCMGIDSTNYKDIFWSIDGHHTSKGYYFMAKATSVASLR